MLLDLFKLTPSRPGEGIRAVSALVVLLCSTIELRSQEPAADLATVYVVAHVDVVPPSGAAALTLLTAYAAACHRMTSRMSRLFPTAVHAALLLSLSVCAPARADAAPFRPPEDVSYHTVDVMSEGVRLTAEVFAPANAAGGGKLPTIVMCHGWGGLAEYLRPDAVTFAQAGYLVVTFDYRGWGASDGRLIAAGKKPASTGGTLTAEVKEIRGVVDPIEQSTDLVSVVNWTLGERQCDPARLGLWGSSYSGGHVLYVAARDARIKALVSQVGGMDSRFVTADPQLRALTYQQGTARAEGKLGYPKPGEKFGALNGMPVLEKLVGYAPVEDVGRIKDCAMLFIVAQNDEVVDNRQHGLLAYARAAEPKKLVVIPGIKHYGIYEEARGRAQQEALAWYNEHLRK